VIRLNKFLINEKYWTNSIGANESRELYLFFKGKKYINSKNELTVRFFMYYMNHIIELPNSLENKRKDIFLDLLNFNFTEKDFMDYKAYFKTYPYGFKNEE
jgi:hypothetical protein